MKVTKFCKNIPLGPSNGKYQKRIDIPAGLRVSLALKQSAGFSARYWLEELPFELFPANSIERHDATYYGILLTEEQVCDNIT